MAEFDEVGRTIENFASEDATVVIGTVLDPEMQDEVKVTVVATGLNRAVSRQALPTRDFDNGFSAQRRPQVELVRSQAKRDGTTGMPIERRRVVWDRLATDLRPRDLGNRCAEVTLDTLDDALDAILAGEARGRWVVKVASG